MIKDLMGPFEINTNELRDSSDMCTMKKKYRPFRFVLLLVDDILLGIAMSLPDSSLPCFDDFFPDDGILAALLIEVSLSDSADEVSKSSLSSISSSPSSSLSLRSISTANSEF